MMMMVMVMMMKVMMMMMSRDNWGHNWAAGGDDNYIY